VTRRIGPTLSTAVQEPANQGGLGGWYVEPGISLEGGELVLREGDLEDPGQNVEAAPQDLLTRFVKLQDRANDAAIHSFAKSWGLLGLCEAHRLPARHKASCHRADSEPTDAWRMWARGANLLWKSGSDVASGRGLDDAARTELAWFHLETGGRQLPWPPWGPRSKPDAKDSRNVALEVGRWLGLGPVALNFQWRWKDPQPTLSLVATSLFSAIALSIAQTMPEGRLSLHSCEGCHEWFAPKRKTQRFCPQCRADGVPARLRQRKSRSLRTKAQQ
jgi:hypothetical protein